MATSEDGPAMAEGESMVDLIDISVSHEIDNDGELPTYSWFHLRCKATSGYVLAVNLEEFMLFRM